jgi:hypothetical protein
MTASFVPRTSDGPEHIVTGVTRVVAGSGCEVILNTCITSRLYTTVWVEPVALFLTDQNSANATFINNRRIPHPLLPGNHLLPGSTH